MSDRELTPFSIANDNSNSCSNDEAAHVLYIDTSDDENDDSDILSVWTEETNETDWSRIDNNTTSAGLPIAINTAIDRSNIFKKQMDKLKPFELSTTDNAHLLERLSDNDLLYGITEIWIRTQLHDHTLRISNVAWYNWVLLDVSRRIYQVYKRDDGDSLMVSLINMVAARVYYRPVSVDLTQDGKPLVHYPLFQAERITRLIKLAAKFSDAVCAASESIDFMFVLNMSTDEFIEFYSQMVNSKSKLYERVKLLRSAFHSTNPLGPSIPARFG